MSGDSPSEESESKALTLALVRRNPWMLGLAALPLLIALGFFGGGIYFTQHIFLALIPHLLILSGALVGMLWTRNPRPHEIEGVVSVREDGVRMGETLVLPCERIKSGFVVPRPGKRPLVRLEKKSLAPAMEIRVENEDEGREVLRRLSLDATQTIASFVLPSRMFVDDKLRKQYASSLLGTFAISSAIIGITRSRLEFLPILIGLAAVTFGVAPMPTDRLLELVEDPHADPMTRANAAVALGANTESDEIRTRLRVVARATAAPRLRVALEKSVDVDDEAALAEALAEVEAEAKKSASNL